MSNTDFRRFMIVFWTLVTGVWLGMAGFRGLEIIEGNETARSTVLPIMWVLIGVLNLYMNQRIARREEARQKENES